MYNKRINKVILITLLTLILINSISIKTYAHDAYFFQVLIDENTMQYVGSVVKDKNPWHQFESKHIEAELWEYDGGSLTTRYDNLEGTTDGKSSMLFTFPPKAQTRWMVQTLNNVSGKDIERAFEIANTLVPVLNDVLSIINNGEKYESIEELISVSEKVIINNSTSGVTHNGWHIRYSDSEHSKIILKNDNTKEEYEFIASMRKGYLHPTLEDGRKSPVYDSNLDYSDNNYTDIITLGMIAMQGNYTYMVKGHLAEDAGEYTKPGTLELKLAELFTDFINGIRSMLGLNDMNELIFNRGTRETSRYYAGIMPTDWMKKATQFHMIFQAITWTILAVAIVKLLFEKNLSTVNPNPAMRISLMEGAKNLIITGFMLVSVFLLINTMIDLNHKIVAIFASTAPDYTKITGISSNYKTFAGVFIQLYYLFITIYLNFVYIIRALTTAILIACAPFFIVTIAFGSKSKGLFEAWARELVANIFLQSFHAFVFSMFTNIQMGTRGVELAVISFALIPTTNWFKGLIVGNSGGIAGEMGVKAFTTATSAVGGFTGALLGNKGRFGGEGQNDKSSYYNSNTEDNIKTKSSSNIPGARTNPERREHSTNTPDMNTTFDSVKKMETDLNNTMDESNIKSGTDITENIDGPTDSTSDAGKTVESTNYEKLSNRFFKNTDDLQKGDGKESAKKMGKAAWGAAVGAAKLGTGAALTMTIGGVTGDVRTGARLMSSGAGNLKEAGKEAIGGISTIGKKSINTLHSKIHSDQGGNILGIERTSSGNTVVHRDKARVAEDGLIDVVKTTDNNVAFTYNKGKLSSTHREYLERVEEAYKNKDFEYLRQRGIEKVTIRGDGATTVHYNDYGQRRLGFIDIYQAGNRIVETKEPGQKLHTDIIYNIDDTPPRPPKLGGGDLSDK